MRVWAPGRAGGEVGVEQGGLQLLILQGQDAGRSVPLEGAVVTLGRPGSGAEGAVEFEEPSVSRVHAVLTWSEADGLYLVSNRSFTNPARVDGEPAFSAPLRPGSRLQLGSLVAELRQGAAAGQAGQAELMGFLEEAEEAGGEPVRHPVSRTRSLIGRSEGCEIHLPDGAVSRHHAVLEWLGSSPVLRHVSATSTTTVNGQPIPHGCRLSPGDRIQLGGSVCLRWIPIELAEAAAARPARPVAAPPSPRAPLAIPAGLRLRDQLWGAGRRARAEFLRTLAGQLGRGEPILRAVPSAATAPLPGLGVHLAAGLERGMNLTGALSRFPGTFDLLETSLVSSGEAAGTLVEHLEVAAGWLEEEGLQLEELWAGLRLPLGGVAASAALGVALLSPLAEGGWAWVVSLGRFGLGAAALGSLGWWGLRLALQSPPLRERWERALARGFGLEGWLSERAAALFFWSLGSLLASGLSIPRASVLAARNCGSLRWGAAYVEVACRLEAGAGLVEALGALGLLDPEDEALLRRAEEGGSLPEGLQAAACLHRARLGEAWARARPRLRAGATGLAAAALATWALTLLALGG